MYQAKGLFMLLRYKDWFPKFGKNTWVAPDSAVIGDGGLPNR